ncbi:MAG TPA: GIY-YIG nuclease family protein [Candidatus Absconditabacterales bacterium]|jgi:group I intron endonuclease|nr:GIY-YIG nuclease family protein [Candidatus Absconditabacterales bacterium]
MKTCGIYKIISPSGKVYIGQSKNIEKRFCQYKRLQCKSQKALHNSLIKYGVENHIFEVVVKCSPEELNINELKYIQEFDSYKNGLNMTKGGETSPMSHPEIAAKMVGKKHSESSKLKRSNTLKNKLASGEVQHGRLHKKHSLETIEKIKQKTKEKRAFKKPNSKKVYCSLTNNEWSSIKECWEELYFDKFSLGHLRSMIKGVKTNTTTIRYST